MLLYTASTKAPDWALWHLAPWLMRWPLKQGLGHPSQESRGPGPVSTLTSRHAWADLSCRTGPPHPPQRWAHWHPEWPGQLAIQPIVQQPHFNAIQLQTGTNTTHGNARVHIQLMGCSSLWIQLLWFPFVLMCQNAHILMRCQDCTVATGHTIHYDEASLGMYCLVSAAIGLLTTVTVTNTLLTITQSPLVAVVSDKHCCCGTLHHEICSTLPWAC